MNANIIKMQMFHKSIFFYKAFYLLMIILQKIDLRLRTTVVLVCVYLLDIRLTDMIKSTVNLFKEEETFFYKLLILQK